ncbi:MAG: hypothetical protein IGQ45_14245 [Cyanobacterium sp. T60_A2020_053]|nr:hypothetical protein [Cyanobacterium sp. T60_A2020_053]
MATILTEKVKTLAELPFDNYRVNADVLTGMVENHLLENPTLSGFFILKNNDIFGIVSRRDFFELMSKEYARDIYTKRPIELLNNSYDKKPLRIDIDTEINEAVKFALERPPETIYGPIVVVRNGLEVGMLELSVLILAQAQMFSSINEKLVLQEQDLRRYAQKIEKEKQKVKEYSEQLEEQQVELRTSNELLKVQTRKLEQSKEEISRKSERIGNLNRSFAELGMLLSKEGRNTFDALGSGVTSMVNFSEEIAKICDSFRDKFKSIDHGTFLIQRISKKVDNLSHQTSIIAAGLPADDSRASSFNMIAEEIKNLSQQIAEANSTINSMAQQLKPEIKFLLKTSEKNKTVVKSLERNSQGTQSALDSLANLIDQGQGNE